MAEPTSTASTGLVAVAALAIGPIAGEYAAIVFGALTGGLMAVARARSMGNWAGLGLLLRVMLTALVLTGAAALWLEHQYHWPAQHLLGPVAFFIGLFGDRWTELLDALWRAALQRLRGQTELPPPGGPQ